METKVTFRTPPAQSGRYAAMAGALVVMVGSFLEWGTADGITYMGMDSDGRFTFTLGLIALLALFIKRIPLWLSIVLGVIIEVLGVIQSVNINAGIAELKGLFASSLTGPQITGSIGIGVYLTIVGAALIVFGGLFQWLKNRRK